MDPIDPELLSDASRAALREAYAAAQPFPHAVLRPLCADAPLRGAFAEMKAHLRGTFRETDLFKLYQTGDLGALDPALAAQVPQLLALRDALYSDEFRAFVRDVSACGPLSPRCDCSCNVYAHGSHLLCHDDVIGTRRVSYIVYLTEPDEGWRAEDGGALQLYPLAQPGVPGTPAHVPSAALLPLWNSMALFTVRPGVSFHDVHEVCGASKLRMSISGWYHAADAPVDAALSSLSQLTGSGPGDGWPDCAPPFQPLPGLRPLPPGAEAPEAELEDADLDPGPLTAAEAALLAEWVAPEYLQPEQQAAVAARFTRDSNVALRAFLRPERAAAIAAATAAADAAAGRAHGALPAHDAGVAGGWVTVGPPHMQRYLACTAPSGDGPEAAAGRLLGDVRASLLSSPAFAKLLWALTAVRPTAQRSVVRRFRPGLDYTVAHHGALTAADRLDATLTFVSDESAVAGPAGGGSVWDSGDVGGFEAYLGANEQGGVDADVYLDVQGDDDGDVISVTPAANTLSLVHRRLISLYRQLHRSVSYAGGALMDEGILHFVRYVSAAAPGSRWDVRAEFEMVCSQAEEEEEAEAEAEED